MERSPHILLVEDNAEVSELLVETLRDAGFSCSTAETVAQARQALAVQKFALLITDLLLPGGILGTALAEEAAEIGIPVLVMTGDAERLDELARHGWASLPKPFRLAAFIDKVRRILREHGALGPCSKQNGPNGPPNERGDPS